MIYQAPQAGASIATPVATSTAFTSGGIPVQVMQTHPSFIPPTAFQVTSSSSIPTATADHMNLSKGMMMSAAVAGGAQGNNNQQQRAAFEQFYLTQQLLGQQQRMREAVGNK